MKSESGMKVFNYELTENKLFCIDMVCYNLHLACLSEPR